MDHIPDGLNRITFSIICQSHSSNNTDGLCVKIYLVVNIHDYQYNIEDIPGGLADFRAFIYMPRIAYHWIREFNIVFRTVFTGCHVRVS